MDGQKNGERCFICGKAYGKDSNARARSKHLSYCRKKHQPGSLLLTRRKACDECVRAKVRCNLLPSGCSRCALRAVQCTYQGSLVDQASADISLLEPNGSLYSEPVMPFVPNATPVDGGLESTNLTLAQSVDTDPALSEGDVILGDLTWNPENTTEPGWPSMLDTVGGSDEEYAYASSSYTARSSTDYRLQNAYDSATLSDRSVAPHSPLATSLAFQDSVLFERRKFLQSDLQLNGDLALHILRSYPHMLASRDSVPPFIHSKYQDLRGTDTTRPSSLSAALNLAKMLLCNQKMNRHLIWGLIRTEQDRLFNERHTFTKWEALEALQSLVIFMLLRITEGRRDYTNFDAQLLVSIIAVCCHITTNYGKLVSSDEMMGRMLSWRDWVFFESRRRAATAVLIMNGILHVQVVDAPPSMPEYAVSPAPSPMALWNAANDVDWAKGYAEHLRQNSLHGMLKNGDLVGMKEAAGKEQDNRWYAYADSFGLLVTLAADMIVDG